jgi:hypothetical protein
MKKTFEEWKKQVDLEIEKRAYGLNSDDLPDYDYWAEWEAGESPVFTAKAAIQNAKDY